MDTLSNRIEAVRPLALKLCQALRDAAAAAGFSDDAVPPGDTRSAHFRLERDPASGADSLIGEWLDRHGHRVGMLVVHADGTCFAEHDIVRAHPGNPRLFVEAAEAYGSADRIGSDLRVMPMLGDAEECAP